jgi:hypothetical protein
LTSAWLQLGFSFASTNLNRTGLRLMDLCYDGWTDRVPQKAPTSTNTKKTEVVLLIFANSLLPYYFTERRTVLVVATQLCIFIILHVLQQLQLQPSKNQSNTENCNYSMPSKNKKFGVISVEEHAYE